MADRPKYVREPEYEYYAPDGTRIGIPDMVMWVGESFYPFPEDFIKEVRKVGLSKRVAGVPDALVYGQTRIWLAHPNCIENPDYDPEYDPKEDPDGELAHTADRFIPGLFGMTIIEGLQFIVDHGDPEVQKKWEELRAQGVQPVTVAQAELESERGCGFRTVGAIYLFTPEDFEAIAGSGIASQTDISGGITQFEPPISWVEGKFFRGISWVDGDAIIQGEDPGNWKLKGVRIPKGFPKTCRDGLHAGWPVEFDAKRRCSACGEVVPGHVAMRTKPLKFKKHLKCSVETGHRGKAWYDDVPKMLRCSQCGDRWPEQPPFGTPEFTELVPQKEEWGFEAGSEGDWV